MSSDLRAILRKVAEEEYKREIREIEERLERYKSLILEVAEAKKWDLLVWVEGTGLKDLKKHEKDLNLLERANLVKGQMKYTERNAYREYQLTKKGNELVKRLLEET
jgi:hypothetical protein